MFEFTLDLYFLIQITIICVVHNYAQVATIFKQVILFIHKGFPVPHNKWIVEAFEYINLIQGGFLLFSIILRHINDLL